MYEDLRDATFFVRYTVHAPGTKAPEEYFETAEDALDRADTCGLTPEGDIIARAYALTVDGDEVELNERT